MGSQLANGTAFPAVAALDLDGKTTNLADAVAGSWGVILFYRGHW